MTTSLAIRALSLNGVPLGAPIGGVFDETGGSIGRADTNSITLPDPGRRISRLQARVSWDRGDFWIQDVGQGVHSLLNGRPIGDAYPARLRANDELQIGGYRLVVDDADATAADVLRQLGMAQRSVRQAADPFEDLVGNRSPAPASAARAVDPFENLLAPLAPAKPVQPVAAGDPFASIRDDCGEPGALDKAFGLANGHGRDPLSDFPLAQANHTPELKAAFVPPRIIEPARAARRAQATAPAKAGSGATAAEMWQQFLDGAGLPRNFPQPPTPYLMRIVGGVLRELTEGVLQLLAARALGKNQVRAEMTVIQARENNPLKFSPNARAALSYLLQPPAAGFMTAPEAVHDAMNDLRTHQVGVMAGLQAALEGVLERFDPRLMEIQLGPGVLDGLAPARRRARLWQLYVDRFHAVRGDGGENLQRLFARAFVSAYEEQVDRLERGQAAARR